MKRATDLINAIRKGERLNSKTMGEIADMLEKLSGEVEEYKQHFEYNQDIADKVTAMVKAKADFDKSFCEAHQLT